MQAIANLPLTAYYDNPPIVAEASAAKAYELPIARSYVRHWKLREAIRELIQNALDHDEDFEYSFDDDLMTITSRYATLSPRTLLLGTTSKADDPDSIGSFGEGYKLALLVLTREGFPVRVLNGSLEWTPAFTHSELFGEEVLVIHERGLGYDAQAVSFEIGGLDTDDRSAIREMCLKMQPMMRDVIGVAQGHILPSQPGKLYVGGLFVCNTDMNCGYNVKPSHIALERDRQTVDGFQLKMLTRDMWLDSKNWERVTELLEQEAPDVELIKYSTVPPALAQVAGELFANKSDGRMPVASQAEAEKFKDVSRTIIAPAALAHVVRASPRYATQVVSEAKVITPKQFLEQWLEANKRYMSRMPKASFKKLIAQSAGWSQNRAGSDIPF